ncbi:MAG TPA: ribosomal-processing cysteine protease Prp [Firmicutes bacterium]|nr:ribosomal-processing cysteine protease Prp [Candidatus Fermentithermobacillaceae bacterium]
MVKVKLQRDFVVDPSGTASRTVLAGYAISGHAGYGDYGEDIVCAGVSALSQAVLLGLQETLGNRVRSTVREGFLSVDIDKDDAGGESAQALMRCLELGLLSLSRQYPKFVSVEYEDR